MVKLKVVEFSCKYLSCFEAVIITILKYKGLPEETPLMGTQAYFVFKESGLSVTPRFNSVTEEWNRIHGLTVETLPVTGKADLREKIIAQLDEDTPLCLPVDLYSLPHTVHHNHLHLPHYVDIFGYDSDCYYMVCPYYGFEGWVDWSLIHSSFFSSTIEYKCLITVPELKLEPLPPQRVCSLVQESCQNMLGLSIPQVLADVDPRHLGLSGIRALSGALQKLATRQGGELPRKALLNLSRQIIKVGYARYWFHKLIQTYQQSLLAANRAAGLQSQFEDVVRDWEIAGKRVAAGVHGNRPELIAHAAMQIEELYGKEARLFNTLLGALPDYEFGRL